MSNPGNFNDHRRALMRLSVQMPALTTAYRLTKDRKYSDGGGAARAGLVRVARHADDAGTALRPGDPGPVHGRGIGIIDTIHLVEVARAIERLDGAPGWSRDEAVDVRRGSPTTWSG